MELLNERKISVLVHPVHPTPTPHLVNLSSPAMEYPFDTTRAITNMILTGAALKFPDIKLIFSHGGGTIPFLAERIAGLASLPWQGGWDREQSLQLMKNFYYDLAGCGSNAQLAALKEFVGPNQLVVGSDCELHQILLLLSVLLMDAGSSLLPNRCTLNGAKRDLRLLCILKRRHG
jgi:predicted TIM-barrel fold metal-dependent hydrolase